MSGFLTLSQIIVSRFFFIFFCKMSICANSLLNSSMFGPRAGYIFQDPEHCQVSICDNSQRNSFIFGFLELSHLFFFIISLSLYVQRPKVDLSNPYKGFCKIRGRQRPPDTPIYHSSFIIYHLSSIT